MGRLRSLVARKRTRLPEVRRDSALRRGTQRASDRRRQRPHCLAEPAICSAAHNVPNCRRGPRGGAFRPRDCSPDEAERERSRSSSSRPSAGRRGLDRLRASLAILKATAWSRDTRCGKAGCASARVTSTSLRSTVARRPAPVRPSERSFAPSGDAVRATRRSARGVATPGPRVRNQPLESGGIPARTDSPSSDARRRVARPLTGMCRDRSAA